MDHQLEDALTLIKLQVTKFTTMTGCNKEPTELCAPAGCGFREVRCLHIILKPKTFVDMFYNFCTRELRSAMTW